MERRRARTEPGRRPRRLRSPRWRARAVAAARRSTARSGPPEPADARAVARRRGRARAGGADARCRGADGAPALPVHAASGAAAAAARRAAGARVLATGAARGDRLRARHRRRRGRRQRRSPGSRPRARLADPRRSALAGSASVRTTARGSSTPTTCCCSAGLIDAPLAPTAVLQLGGADVSAALQRLLAARASARLHVVVAPPGAWPRPGLRARPTSSAPTRARSAARARRVVRAADGDRRRLAAPSGRARRASARRALDAAARRASRRSFEGTVLAELVGRLPDGATLLRRQQHAGAALDTFVGGRAQAAHASRATAARTASTAWSRRALGAAAARRGPTVLVVGDSRFLPRPRRRCRSPRAIARRCVVLVVNNDGGGIFSFLPQADARRDFETLFGTPHGLDARACRRRCTAAGYVLRRRRSELAAAIDDWLARPGAHGGRGAERARRNRALHARLIATACARPRCASQAPRVAEVGMSRRLQLAAGRRRVQRRATVATGPDAAARRAAAARLHRQRGELGRRRARAFRPTRRVIAIDLPGHGGDRRARRLRPLRLRASRATSSRCSTALACARRRCSATRWAAAGAAPRAGARRSASGAWCSRAPRPGSRPQRARARRRTADGRWRRSIERDGIEAFVDRWEALPLFRALAARLPAEGAGRASQRLACATPTGSPSSLRGLGAGAQALLGDRLDELAHADAARGRRRSTASSPRIADAAAAARCRTRVLRDRGGRRAQPPPRAAGRASSRAAARVSRRRHGQPVADARRVRRMTHRLAAPCAPTRTSSTRQAEGIAKITINRPEVRNAFRPQTVIEMSDAFADARDDRDVGVVDPHRRGRPGVLLAAATRRCAATAATSATTACRASTCSTCSARSACCPSRSSRWSPATRSAAATCCTWSATSRSRPTTPSSARPARRSAASTAATARSYLARIVGQKKAREIWFLCRQYDAQQALDMGLVNTVVPLAELEDETVQWCREILEKSPTALRFLKAAFNADTDGLAGLQELAGDATLLYYMTEEAQEGKRRLRREAQARLLALPAPAVTARCGPGAAWVAAAAAAHAPGRASVPVLVGHALAARAGRDRRGGRRAWPLLAALLDPDRHQLRQRRLRLREGRRHRRAPRPAARHAGRAAAAGVGARRRASLRSRWPRLCRPLPGRRRRLADRR